MIRVADYIFRRLVQLGVEHVFMITGGGAMFLDDAIGRTPGLKYICNHHEQGCSVAAEGYARITGKLGVCCLTTGPGGTNAITGTIGHFLDSVPTLTISGQVKFESSIHFCPDIPLRQLGDQEINIIELVRPVTKYAVMITDPLSIRYHLEKAVFLATSARPGPVWLDIPQNVQSALIDPETLPGYEEFEKKSESSFPEQILREKVEIALQRLENAKSPLILAGQGVRIAGGIENLRKIIDRSDLPISTSLNGCDLVPTDHPNYIGRVGTIGERSGNFAIQNADLVFMLGTRNNYRQTGYNRGDFARSAFKIIVDVDPAELDKPGIRPDLSICCDVGRFLEVFLEKFEKNPDFSDNPQWSCWKKWCKSRRERYPVVLPEYEKCENGVQPYDFARELTKTTDSGVDYVFANATANIVFFQAGIVKEGQRFLGNSGSASMGYDLPAAIGATLGSKKTTVCVAGDGSIMMNLQELATIRYLDLPIKVFILLNDGYVSIRQTQDGFFGKPHFGCGPQSGVGFPDFAAVARAFGFPVLELRNRDQMPETFEKVFANEEPVVCVVHLTPDYVFAPKSASQKLPDGTVVSKPLDDMFPFLDPGEYRKNRYCS